MGKICESFNEDHLKKFKQFIKKEYGKRQWRDRRIANCKKLFTSEQIECLSKHGEILTRCCLRKICEKNSRVPASLCLRAIMVWGGQHKKHIDSVFSDSKPVESIIKRLRKGSLSRFDAYEEFFKAREKGKMKGLGVAFYTKIIFFCHPEHNGYIMDQWTAKSANLLTHKDEDIIHVKRNNKNGKKHLVTDDNTKCNYKDFCEMVECLAKHFNRKEKEEIELAMFSKGGTKPWGWRKYVEEKYVPNPPKLKTCTN